jgi:hypothetical protein
MALASVAFADSHLQSGSGAGTERTSSVRISDVEIAIAARACLVKGLTLYVVRENGKPVATGCIADHRYAPVQVRELESSRQSRAMGAGQDYLR